MLLELTEQLVTPAPFCVPCRSAILSTKQQLVLSTLAGLRQTFTLFPRTWSSSGSSLPGRSNKTAAGRNDLP
jgi:hypothetical protein